MHPFPLECARWTKQRGIINKEMVDAERGVFVSISSGCLPRNLILELDASIPDTASHLVPTSFFVFGLGKFSTEV